MSSVLLISKLTSSTHFSAEDTHLTEIHLPQIRFSTGKRWTSIVVLLLSTQL